MGAFLAGHFGDKYGRKVVLMLTLILMGVATALIGLLPTYEAIGAWAPALLILLRILQGISAGGEWGGAVLMAVEHAPKAKRGLFGASPQIGVPLGLLLASGVMALMAVIAPGDAFLAWGWRVPFLLSVVLILIGYYVRRRVEESPVFTELAERKEVTRMPIVQLFRKHALLVLIAALVFAGNNAVGYMTTGGYIQNYSTNPDGPIGLERGPVLWAVAGSAVVVAPVDVLRRLALGPHRPPHDLHHRLDHAARRRLHPLPARQHRRHRDAVPRPRDPHDRPRLHLRAAGSAVLRAVPRLHPLLGCLDLVRDRRDHRRRVRSDDRRRARGGDRLDQVGRVLPRRA